MAGGLLGAIGTGVGAYFGGPTGAGFGGAIGGGLDGMLSQQATNSQNADMAQSQMDFQAYMSNTSYQRAVADMKAAGLSPMLAYHQGGASTPVGAMATMQNPATSGAQVAGTYSQIAQNAANLENIKADTTLKGAQTHAAEAQASAAEAAANQSAWSAYYGGEKASQDIKESSARVDSGMYGASAAESNARAELVNNQATALGKEIEQGGPEAGVRLLKAQYDKALADTGNVREATDLLKFTILKTDAATKLMNLDIEAAMSADNVGRKAGEYKPLIDLLKSILSVRHY